MSTAEPKLAAELPGTAPLLAHDERLLAAAANMTLIEGGAFFLHPALRE